MDLEDITIETDLGNIQLPTQEIFDFVLKLGKENKRRSDLRQADIEDFFGDSDYETEYFSLNHFKVQSYIYCLWEVINRDYEIIRLTNYDGKYISEKPTKGYDFKISLNEKKHLLIDFVAYLKNKETGDKMALAIMPYNDGDKIFVEIESFYSNENISFRDFWNSVKDYFKTEGPLKNALFDTKWDYVDFKYRDWDSIVISDEQRKVIDRNVINFISNLEQYKELRLPTSRGVLITGPPGTGKTLLCETIISQVECTKIYVTSDSVNNIGDIKQIYKVARVLAPTIVIIEDIDTLGALDRREGGNHPLLGEFLNCLNGVGSNDGVVTLATTNYPKHLDVALVDRPGRIDLRIEFGLPDKDLREHIFKKYLDDLETKKINYTTLSKKSEGMTGAYIREVVMSAYIIAQEGNSIITQEIVEEALNNVQMMKKSLYTDVQSSPQVYYN